MWISFIDVHEGIPGIVPDPSAAVVQVAQEWDVEQVGFAGVLCAHLGEGGQGVVCLWADGVRGAGRQGDSGGFPSLGSQCAPADRVCRRVGRVSNDYDHPTLAEGSQ